MSALTVTPTAPNAPNAGRAVGRARVRDDGPIPLNEAAKYVPADNQWGHASPATLLRWIVHGKAGVQLDAVRIRGVWHPSMEAVARVLAGKGGGRWPGP